MTARLTDEELTEAFEYAHGSLRLTAALSELKERRAADRKAFAIEDAHLVLLEQSLARIENEYKPTCESVNYGSGCPGATAESIDFWRRAVDALPAMISELRSARGQGVTEEDVAALRDVATYVRNTRGLERGSIVLDRLVRTNRGVR